MNVYKEKSIKPMLLKTALPFDSTEFLFELKLDGVRCIMYVENGSVTLKSRNGKDISARYGLNNIAVKDDCILDGELVALKCGKPDLYALLGGGVCEFAAFDILYRGSECLCDFPLIKRKEILYSTVENTDKCSIVEFVENEGKAFFELVKAQGLEGIVAKRKKSIYRAGVRSEDWLKIKAYSTEQLYVCGYYSSTPHKLILCNKGLMYAGEINIKAYKKDRERVLSFAEKNKAKPLFDFKEDIVWLKPSLECRVQYLNKTEEGRMRHSKWLGLV